MCILLQLLNFDIICVYLNKINTQQPIRGFGFKLFRLNYFFF